jgi:hypothetical protein
MSEFKIPGAARPRRGPPIPRADMVASLASDMLEGAAPGTEFTEDDLGLDLGTSPLPRPGAAAPSVETARFDAADAQQRERERRLNLAQQEAKSLPAPDAAVKLRAAASQRGVAFGLALRDPPIVEEKGVAFSWGGYANNRPLSDLLLDPTKSVLTSDEAEKLARIAGLDKEPFSDFHLGKVWEGGDLQIQRDILYAKKGFAGGVLDPAEQAELERIQARTALLPQADSVLGMVGEGIVQQGPRMLRMAGAGGAGLVAGATGGFLLGGPAGSAAVAPLAAGGAIFADNAVQATGNIYAELTDEIGVPHEIAWPASMLGGAVVSGLDSLSFGMLTKFPALNVLRKIPAFQKLTKETIRPALRAAVKDARFGQLLVGLLKDGAVEAGTEGAQELAQILTGYAAAEVAPGDQRTPSAAEAGQRVALSMVVGGAVGGVVGGIGTAARELALRADTGERSKEFIARLYEVTGDLKSAERAPEVLKEYVDRTAKTGPAQKVTIPGEKMVSLAQAATTPEQKAFFARPDIARQMEQAQATGARVSLSLGDFAAYVRVLDQSGALKNDIGLNDEMSPGEAKELSAEIKKARKEMADVGKRREELENEPTSLITRHLEPQLKAAGATVAGARVQAALVASGVSALARRSGKDPWEVYKNAKIRVSAVTHERTGAQTLEQASPQGVKSSLYGKYLSYEHPESPLQLRVSEEDLGDSKPTRVVGLLTFSGSDVKSITEYGSHGYSTALYLKALADAQRAGAGFSSDLFRSDATEKMYARLAKLGIPFEKNGMEGDRYYLAAEKLAAVDLDAAWEKLLARRLEGVTDEEIESVVGGLKELQHRSNDAVRGRVTFDASRSWFLITLTGKADLSTFLHESAHYLLELMRKLDQEAGADSPFAADLRALEAWAGVKPGEEWSVEALEKFARGMETYFGEGAAPAPHLAAAFATFKNWIIATYRTLLNLGAPLTPEVRGVMDRMLATQEEIDSRRIELGYFPSGPMEADMTEAQQKTYRALYERGAQRAQAAIEHEAILAFRKEKTEIYAGISAAVEKELDTHPTLALRAWFKDGSRIDGGLSIPHLAGQKLDPEAVKALGGKGLKGLVGSAIDAKTIDPSELAPYFGFKTGSEMLDSLASTPSRATLKAQMVKEKMTARYPAYGVDKGWATRAALERLHDEDSISNAIELELRASRAKAGLPPLESPARVAVMAARENALEMTRKELDAPKYREAESRAHRAAMKAYAAKDFATAAEENRKRLYARAMWRAVTDAATRMDAAQDYVERFGDPSVLARLGRSSQMELVTGERVGPMIRDAARSLSEMVGLAKKSPASDQPYEARAAKLIEIGLPVLPFELGALGAWETLSYADALALRATLKNLSAVASTLNSIRVGEEETKLEEIAADVVAGLKEQGVFGRLGRKGEKKSSLRAYRTGITGPEMILLDLDGGKIGTAHRLWMGSAEKGQFESERRHILRRDDLNAIWKKHRPAGWAKLMGQTFRFSEGDGAEYTGAEVFAMLLNWGSATNRMKLVEGMKRAAGRTGWSYDSALAFIHRVFPDRAAYDYAQAYWTYISSENLWEDSARVAEQIYGVRPEKVEALSVPTPDGGSVEGGYYPLIVDSNVPRTEMEATKADALDAMDLNPLATMYAAHGFTEKRTGYAAPLLLDPTAFAAHLYEVDHFISQAQGVYDRHRFLTHPEVKAAVVHSLGIEAWRELKASNNFIAAGGKRLTRELLQMKGVMNSLLFHNALLTMGGNVLSGVNQVVTGVPALISRLGPKALPMFAKTLAQFASSPFQMWKEVGIDSGEIRGMETHIDKDIRIVLDRGIVGGKMEVLRSIRSRVATTTMTPIVFGQKIVNVIAFRTAKNLALAEGKSLEYAVAAGNSAIRLSQSSSAEKDLTEVQRSDDLLVRILTSLASYTFALNNLVMPRRLTAKEVAGTTMRLTTLILTTMMARALLEAIFPLLEEKEAERRKGLEKWAEDLEIPGALALVQATLDVVGNVPLIGRGVQSVISGRTPRYASWVDTVARSPEAVEALFSEQGFGKRDAKVIIDTIGLATGVPTRHILFAPGEFAYEFINGNVDESPWSFFQELALARPGQKGQP